MKKRAETVREAVTILDVAREAGVATSTVSRALTQSGRVSETMRKHVLNVAVELGYRPNLQARSLSSGRTHTLALLIPGATNPYFFDLIRGTQAEAKVRNYRHMLVDTEASADLEEQYLQELSVAVDGVVLAGSRLSDERLVAIAQKLPMVVVNREIDGVQSVVVDTSTAVTQALNYIASLGHSRVAFLGGPLSSWSSRKRWEALQAAADRLQVECLNLGHFGETQSGAAAADAALHHKVTACLFFNDMLAIAGLKRFAELGVSVPGDISVVGCDDIFGADFCNPPLTTLTARIDQVARTATNMLLTRLLGLPMLREREKVPASLTVRQSTGPAPAARSMRSVAG
ncbi:MULTISPECIES: LacI family DNA-binding transcriptional regulator [unclassified Chelatococcus]|uniref:LacI family DNA-binding transcriptional regulator n=1 Tax=unclassified Chelatococcus TaxID=2638111 RepID=UPI001BCCA1BD|nr:MULTISPECIES: LacI family DNA-binding transcriptional regulator [unclassified Chelatococcus]MBS7700763.1 LacI family DNA-binding transcriptional regulator [Chelatococcus sp. YT9]MBX3559347.1 LacI family DNA-binding transcriptional regulator [Chelatococcus sp.]